MSSMAIVAELRSWYQYLHCSRVYRLEPGKPRPSMVLHWARESSTLLYYIYKKHFHVPYLYIVLLRFSRFVMIFVHFNLNYIYQWFKVKQIEYLIFYQTFNLIYIWSTVHPCSSQSPVTNSPQPSIIFI